MPSDLADEVVQGDVEGALGRPVPADRVAPCAWSGGDQRRRVVEGRGSPTASSRSGNTAAIVSGVSP